MSINKYIICKGVLLLLVVVAFAPPAHASVIQLQPNNLGLVGYWSFNDGVGTKAGDSSGFGNTGTLATDGSALPTWTTGKFGKALAFDGINGAGSYVDVASGGAISKLSGAMTVCAWIKKSTDFTYDNSIITNATVIGSNANTQYDLEVIQTGQVDFAWTTDGSLFETRSSANGLVQAGIWYFLCGVRDAGGSGYIFLNGVDVSFTPVNDPNNVVPAALGGDTLIGRWAGNGNQMFSGAIDEVRLYNRALASSSIMALYQSGAARINASSATLQNGSSLASGLVGYWTFDGADITSAGILDRSGFGNNGYYLNGATSSAKVAGKIGQALNFVSADGTYVDIATSTSLKIPGDVTVCTWFKRNTMADGDYVLVSNGNPATIHNAQYELETHGDGGVFFGWFNGTGAAESTTSVALLVTTGVWYHTCGVRNGGVAFIYLNGTDVSATGGGSITPTVSPEGDVQIGGPGSGQYVNGPMDDVRIYNRALSASEIKQLYTMNAVAFNTSSSNLTNGSTLTSGLVGHWTFDGPDITTSILDKSGNGNNGGFGGGSTSSAKVAGKLGQGLQFDGVNDYVDMGNPASLQTTGDLTLSVWIKPTSFPGTDDNTVLMKAGPGDCAYKMDVTRDSSGGAPGLQHFYMFVTSDNNRCVPGAGTGAQRYNTTMLATSTWNHIVGVYRAGTSLDVYLNGVLDDGTLVDTSGSPAIPATVHGTSTATVKMGYDWIAGQNPFAGSMDDARIYNRALTAAEVKQLYLIGK